MSVRQASGKRPQRSGWGVQKWCREGSVLGVGAVLGAVLGAFLAFAFPLVFPLLALGGLGGVFVGFGFGVSAALLIGVPLSGVEWFPVVLL